MLNKSFFKQLKSKHDSYSKLRSSLIHKSHDILRNAKRAIFSMHRDEMSEAEKLLKNVEVELKNLQDMIKKEAKLAYEGAYLAALEEYVEARLFMHYLKKKKVEVIKDAHISLDTYLAALSDFTGELKRRAVLLATKGKQKEVDEIKEVVEDIIHELLKFDLTSYLRTKHDQAKNNLKKLEDVLYQIKMRGK